MKMHGVIILVFVTAICAFASAEGTDPDIYVDVYDPDKACNGTTLLPDHHDYANTRVIEVDMTGNVVWEYVLPEKLRRYTNPGFDAELLPNDNILLVLPKKGICEVDRAGNIVWSHWDVQVSHDADRLPNGNTIYVFGDSDETSDAQVKEVNPKGELVWSWYAEDHFDPDEYDTDEGGWTHMNAVVRLENGNTLLSPRNFNMLVEIDPEGEVVDIIGEDYLRHQHDPVVLPDGNILVANHDQPQEIIEINRKTGEIDEAFTVSNRRMWPLRDADRLPNGNMLITGSIAIIEITPAGEVVWRLNLDDSFITTRRDAPSKGFFKAQRLTR